MNNEIPTYSPFLDWLGTRILEWRDGFVKVTFMAGPEHLNRSGVVHGGVLATLLDHVGGFAGLFSPHGEKMAGVTLSLTCNFVAQAPPGKLYAIGTRIGGGRRIYFATAEVRGEGGELIAVSSNVHRYLDGVNS